MSEQNADSMPAPKNEVGFRQVVAIAEALHRSTRKPWYIRRRYWSPIRFVEQARYVHDALTMRWPAQIDGSGTPEAES